MSTNPPNKALRLAVPLILVLVGIGAAAAIFINETNAPTPEEITAQTPPPAEAVPPIERDARPNDQQEQAPQTEADPSDDTPAETPGPVETGVSDEPEMNTVATPLAEGAVLRARPVASEPLLGLGSDDADSGFTLSADFTWLGAGLETLRLTGVYDNIADLTSARLGNAVGPEKQVLIQSIQARDNQAIAPFAAIEIEIATPGSEPITVPLTATTVPDEFGQPQTWRVWRQTAPGAFEAVIEDEDANPVIRIERSFVISAGSNDVLLRQRVFNDSDLPLDIRWTQFGPVDLPQDAVTYGGDKRRVRFGYLSRPSQDPARGVVLAQDFLKPRKDTLGSKNKQTGRYEVSRGIWPNERSIDRDYSLVWAAMTNRYFGVAVHPVVNVDSPAGTLEFDTVKSIERITLDSRDSEAPIALKLISPRLNVAPGGSLDLSHRMYAGPTNKPEIRKSPHAVASGIEQLVVYNFGGPCAFCTFTWLTGPLISLLRVIHSFTGDYTLAIMGLVIVVRSILHPVTRWSQIRMQRFGKQMADMAPKQKKIQEKFKDDPKKLQEEMAKLWREEGVNPAGMLGCLPMFLQSPVWIALYATLYFAFDLRHEAAFYGVFQSVTGGAWQFMADLAEPDHIISLPAAMHFNIPLMGEISSFNVLPILLGIVFFVHQKFLTPPTSASMTPEQEAQQKMIRVMSVVMFPVIMYNAPSGLAVYFITNSGLGILESKWIRAHIDANDLLTVKKKPKKPGSGEGFMARMQRMADEQKKLQEQKLSQMQRMQGGGKGKKGMSPAERARRGKQ